MSLQVSVNRPVATAQPLLRRMLKAMNEPGVAVRLPCVQRWPGISPAAAALLATLHEVDAPLWWDDILAPPALRASPRQNGASPGHELPAALALLHAASDPDLSAIAATGGTIILEVPALNGGLTLRLRGPGIQERRAVAPQLPPQVIAFLRTGALHGQRINLMLTCGDMLMVLPRTVQLSVC